jgi:alpha-D-ribose 1-methylphosphonate 5-triphosphate synthase subunit PhnH
VPERLETRVPAVPAEFFEARARAIHSYPCGIDIQFVDGDGRLIALPRSTSVTIIREEGERV